ncbi:DMT family transporter [Marinomonas balearica]|uniref:EamA domain-containing membrane protein RarD n=1 Tax=Marinomonas balearica TaxID=491947 RepID=A0A4R6MA13_9GAMM|nr:DMT family transporter [Marinomonas balearica]TDO98264.1 EamA domain-containing membrane protein RarD [Marinomonas balearica]
MTNQKQAMLFGLGAVLLWSTVATAFSLALKHYSPVQLLLVATVTSFVFLLLIVIKNKEMTQLIEMGKTEWKTSLLLGAINPFVYYLILLYAYNQLPAQEAQAINYTWGIVLSFMAIPILGQKLRLADLIAAAFCYFGVLYIATRGNVLSLEFANLYGVGLALISTVIWALYWLINTKDKRPGLIGLTLNFSFALPLIVLYAIFTGELNHWPEQGLLPSVYIGFFEMGVSFILWNLAMKRADRTSQLANLIFLSPILSIVWLSQIANEPILISTLVGLVCILLGLTVQNWKKSKKA